MSLSGGYLPIEKTTESLVPEGTAPGFQPLNRFHRALLCWSFQNALLENEHIARAIQEINPTFAELYKIKRDYDVHMNTTYTTTLKELLYVRLREGFTVKNVTLVDDRIQMLLALPFRPGTFLEYGIDAPWPTIDKREQIQVDLVVSGPESEVRDLKISKTTEGVYRANALRVSLVHSLEDACRRVIEADTVMLHIHAFNTHAMYYSLPPGTEVFPLYHYNGKKKDRDDTSVALIPKFQPRGNDPFSNFLRFWKIVCHMRHEEWQKWVHVHYERAILHCRPRGNICIENNNEEKWRCSLPRKKMHSFLMKMSSFCLIKNELYVVFVTRTADTIPNFFYMIRVYEVIPYVVFKIAFLGGICSTERRMLVSKFKKMLSQMTYSPNGNHHEQKVLVVMKRPLERILIQYEELPKNIFLTQWTIGKEDVPLEKPLRVENERHNSIAKYLEGRRHVWKFPLSVLEGNALGSYGETKRIAEVCTNCLLQKRLHEGFRVAWMKNMIIGLCRQVEVKGRCMLEQYIIFQPSSKTYLESEKIITGSTRQPGFLLVAEFWCEPCLVEDEKGVQSPRATLDDDLIVCIYTVNHLLNICNNLPSVTALNTPLAKEKDGRFVTPRVSSVDCPFNLHTLLRHSRRLLLHMPIFELADDANWEIRNAIFSSSFFEELGDHADLFIDIQDPTVFAKIFTQLLIDNKHESRVNLHTFKEKGYDDKYQAKCRVFIKHSHIHAVTVFIVPAVNVLPENERSWPFVVTVCEESLTTYSIIRNSPHNRAFEYTLNRSSMGREELEGFPSEDDLNDIEIQRWASDRDVPVMRVNYRQIRIKPMVEEMQKAIAQRAMVSALFKCLKMGKGATIDRDEINFILDEICDYTNVELQGVPDFINCFCQHLAPQPNKDHSLCEVSHFQTIFNDALKENSFHSVSANPVYYFFNPTPSPKELHRRNSNIAEACLGGNEKAYPQPFSTKSESPEFPTINFSSELASGDCPLFIFFHCALILPAGEEEYVAVDYIPSCVNQVLQTAGKTIETEDLAKVKIKLLMYVLTWPTKEEIKDTKEDTDSDDTEFSGRGKKFIRKLPYQEREILRDTMHSLNRFLELECLLVQNMDPPVSLEHLQNLSRFITRTVGKTYCDIRETDAEREGKVKKNLLTKRIRQRFRNLKFVIPSTDAFHTLVDRLDMKQIEYCILRKVEGANMFYIRKMENKRAYEMFLKRELQGKKEGKRIRCDSNSSRHLLSRTESEISILSTSGNLDLAGGDLEKMLSLCPENSCTFWVILSIEKTISVVGDEEIRVKLQFCERYAAEPSHSKIYSSTWNEMRAEIRRINQEILLENMFYTRNCSPFLLTKEEKDIERTSDRRTFSETTEEDEDGVLDLSMAHTAFYDFAPGSLACPLVWEKWFEIHPRLRRKHPYGHLHEIAVTLRRSLEQHIVLNIPNTFVFRSEDGYMLYGQIYSSFEQFSKSGKRYKLGFDEVKEKVRAKFSGSDKNSNGKAETSILFVGFGVTRPSDSMVRLISEGLIEKKITDEVLETLVEIYKKNPRALLESYDVEFIQPDYRQPSTVYYFSIPAVMHKFTSAVRLYYLQHMSQFNMCEARVREGLSGTHNNYRPFYSYPYVLLPGQRSNPKYYPQFHLLNLFKKEGRSHSGIAVIELRIVTEQGLIDKLQDGLLRQDSHTSLCPPLDDRKLIFDWFERATTTYCEVVENPRLSPEEHPKPPNPVQDACGYVQAIIWQVGDVGLSQLQQMLTDVVEGAFLDVVTEYGVLNREIISSVSHNNAPPTSPSATTPSKIRTPSSASKISSGRQRDSTDAVHSSLTSLSTSAINISTEKRGSSVFVYDHGSRRGSNHELSRDDFVLPMARNPEHISFSFKQNIENWFEYIRIRRNNERLDYQKHEYELRHSILVPQTLNQIEIQLKRLLSNPDNQLSDKVQLFQHANSGTCETPRYDLLSGLLKEDILTEALPNDAQPRFILTAYCHEVHCNTRRYGYEIAKNPQDAPSVLAKLADQYKDCKWLFLPTLEETFIPRQTFLLLKEHNNKLTLYAYNFLPLIYYEVADMILRVVMWQNAKYRLYEHILENPLDPVLPPVEDDELTEVNSYTQMIGADPDILITEQAPPDNFENIVSVPISAEVASRLFRARKTYTAQVPQACKFQRTFQKFKEMRKEVKQQVEDYQSNKLMYDDLCQGMTEVAEHQLTTMWAHSRRVHYVQTPVLLSPAWRRKIAQVRRGTMDTPPQKVKPPTPSSLTSTSRSRAPTSSSVSTSRQITFPAKNKEEDELFDPCHVKMLHDLTEEYVNYLKTLGLSLLNVSNISEQSVGAHRYKMEYPQGGRKPPDVCLFLQLLHGVLLVRLHFVPPYFIMSVGMWAAPELLLRDQQLTEKDSKKYLSDLESVKDMIVAKCHIHSFTYDFHLRMISRYLIHKEIMFPNGYNTSTFLIDFLKYYACRPPSARNSVYEERTAFHLHRNVDPVKVWECFLEKNYEEKYCWRVLRIRITDEETELITRANEYMLVSNSDLGEADGHAKICVLLRDRRRKEADGCIYLAQYMILVNQEKNNPLEESRQREGSSKSNVGEFRSVPVPTEEQMSKEVDDMMMLIQEGGLPTVEGKVFRRRRFNSGGHTPPLQVNTSGDTDPPLHSPGALHGSESEANVPVQGDPTLRHRKNAESSEEGEIPNEKANYIQYISGGQRKLQQLLETTTSEYSKQITHAVEEANRECLREFLWRNVHMMASPAPQLPKLGPQVRLGTSGEIWNSLKVIQHSVGQYIIDLCQLVEMENMKDREPRLATLLESTNCARLCRFLVYKFGVRRCRLFETPNTDPKPPRQLDSPPDIANVFFCSSLRHLLINNPDNPLLFLVRCEQENHPDLIILFKKNVNQLNAHFAGLLDKAFDELVQSITAFLWSDLIYRPPGRTP